MQFRTIAQGASLEKGTAFTHPRDRGHIDQIADEGQCPFVQRDRPLSCRCAQHPLEDGEAHFQHVCARKFLLAVAPHSSQSIVCCPRHRHGRQTLRGFAYDSEESQRAECYAAVPFEGGRRDLIRGKLNESPALQRRQLLLRLTRHKVSSNRVDVCSPPLRRDCGSPLPPRRRGLAHRASRLGLPCRGGLCSDCYSALLPHSLLRDK